MFKPFILGSTVLVIFSCSVNKEKPQTNKEAHPTPGETAGVQTPSPAVRVDNPDPRLQVTSKGDGLIVRHALAYKHHNPCNFSGSKPELDSLVDFQIEFESIFEGLRAAVLKRETGPVAEAFADSNDIKVERRFIEKIKVGGKRGYRIFIGAEGCGQMVDYLEVGPWTLRLTEKVIGEFNPVSDGFTAFEKLPGIISPMEMESLLTKLLETARLSKPSTTAQP